MTLLLSEKDSEIGGVEGRLACVEFNFVKQKDAILSLQATSDAVQLDKNRADERVQLLLSDLESLTQKHADLTDHHSITASKLQSQNQNLHETNERLETSIFDYQTTLNQLESDIDSLHSTVQLNNAQIATLGRENKEVVRIKESEAHSEEFIALLTKQNEDLSNHLTQCLEDSNAKYNSLLNAHNQLKMDMNSSALVVQENFQKEIASLDVQLKVRVYVVLLTRAAEGSYELFFTHACHEGCRHVSRTNAGGELAA